MRGCGRHAVEMQARGLSQKYGEVDRQQHSVFMLMHVACVAALLTRFRQSVSALCKVKCALPSHAARDFGDNAGK